MIHVCHRNFFSYYPSGVEAEHRGELRQRLYKDTSVADADMKQLIHTAAGMYGIWCGSKRRVVMWGMKSYVLGLWSKAAKLRMWKQAELGCIKTFLQKEKTAGRYEPVWPGLD